ncbi:hypothetical protein HDU98_005685 [Podochytrium sp. JEL0797]|nr:hypothetical protein HDU98_005685 [Podochytrium sp. JEL0797]
MARPTIQDRLTREESGAQDSDDGESETDASDSSSSGNEDDSDAVKSVVAPKAKNSAIKIFVRVRPGRKNDAKLHLTAGRYACSPGDDESLPKIAFRVPKDTDQGLINNQKENYDYRFNNVFDQNTTQEEVFDNVAKDVIIK